MGLLSVLGTLLAIYGFFLMLNFIHPLLVIFLAFIGLGLPMISNLIKVGKEQAEAEATLGGKSKQGPVELEWYRNDDIMRGEPDVEVTGSSLDDDLI